VSTHRYRRLIATSALVLGLLAGIPAPTSAVTADEPMLDVIVHLRPHTDLTSVSRKGNQRVRRSSVIAALKATADSAQRPLRRDLARLAAKGQVERVRPFWISDAIALRATRTVLDAIRSRPEVVSVTSDETFSPPTATASSQPVSANLSEVGADNLWAQGVTGAGVVVAILDTGVDVDHPDLAGRWRGGSNSWFDPYAQHPITPIDLSGHGTSVTGIVLGGGASGSAIGMAPDARWIAARVFDDQGRGTSSAIHAALQWVTDPDNDPATDDAADVVNNSWAFGAPGCNLEFQPDLIALRALDILPVFAAGNGGPYPQSSYSPANYPEGFAVGSVNGLDAVMSSSSRGPSACGGRSRSYPDVVAPGSAIPTADLYGLWTTASGTSMAAPHVAGALALLLSGHPGLTASAQEAALLGGAVDLGPTGPDDNYGSGRLDTRASWDLVGPTDAIGPTTSNVRVAPDPSNFSVSPVVVATADDTASGGSAVTDAEAFVDLPGSDGTGVALTPVTAVASHTDVTGALTGSYSEGPHTVFVHSRDAAGHWGQLSAGAFVVDRSAPSLRAVTLTHSPTAGRRDVIITATADDAGGVAGVEIVELGARVPVFDGAMAAVDGTFGGSSEPVTASIAVAGWSAGQHLLQVSARDLAGNRSAASLVTLVVAPSDGVFADGFETGGMSHWSRTYGRSRLTVTTSRVPVGSAALRATISGATPSYVEDNTPAAETTYRARFWFDPRGTRTTSSGHDVLAGLNGHNRTVFRVQYRRTSAGVPQVRAVARRRGGETATAWTSMTAGPHAIELGWTATTHGRLQLMIDGVLNRTVTRLANATMRLQLVRLGPSAGLGSRTSGTEIFDGFASSRSTMLRP
jgi:subtilisin family serine protease